MKKVLFLVIVHLCAYSVVRAEEIDLVAGGKSVDECRSLLPKVENEYREVDQRYYSLREALPLAQEEYLVRFNQMTQELFRITDAREEETRQISSGREQLRTSMQKFNEQKTEENSKNLQDSYLNLTLQIYSGLVNSQKNFDNLKGQLLKVETARSDFTVTRNELDHLDHQKLALEAKMISLKIKCNPDKKY